MRNKELVEALEALPKKELGVGWMYRPSTGCYCAVGAMVRNTGKVLLDNYIGLGDAVAALNRSSVDFSHIVDRNDGFTGTDEERYAHMHTWAKEDTI